MPRILERLLLPLAVALALFVSGCANVGYYLQTVGGQLDIWRRGRPIDEMINDPTTPDALKSKLATVLQVRGFASRELGLPENESYRRYVDLERPFVVWNVFAAPEFSTKPVQWCFPFAGCVSYRGYFDKTDADNFAASLNAQGNDVFVGGVPAYSTLGWFADPVFNTFVRYPDIELARLVFHELAHQVVYVGDDSVFNESFAVTVEIEGVRRWLAREGNARQKEVFERAGRRRAEFAKLIQAYRNKLDVLYATRLGPDAMRARKTEVLREMEEDYQQLKVSWGGYRGFDRWFAQKPNNALLASVAIYTQMVPEFQALLHREGGDLPSFYRAVKELARLGKSKRIEALHRLSGGTAAAR